VSHWYPSMVFLRIYEYKWFVLLWTRNVCIAINFLQRSSSSTGYKTIWYEFPIAAIKNYHKLGNFKQDKFITIQLVQLE
jgi:hypothetical protein